MSVPVVPIQVRVGIFGGVGGQRPAYRLVPFLRVPSGKRGERRTLLEGLHDSTRTEAFYEAPHRLLETLEDVVEVLGPARHIVVAREITKIHEEFLRGKAERSWRC